MTNLVETLLKQAPGWGSAMAEAAVEIERLTAERDMLVEALAMISWSNDTKWQADSAKQALAAVKEMK